MNTTKKVLSLAVIFLIINSIVAQDSNTVQNLNPTEKLEKKMARLTQKLNLTPQQASELKAIFVASQDKIKSIKKEQMKAIHNILTPEQQKEWMQMKQHQHEKMNRMGRHKKNKAGND